MTIDERLERLTERHEALAQSLELLTKNVEEMRGFIHNVAEGTARLLHVAELHETRLDSHDDRLDKLEGH